jgi:hypothetical protein
MSDDQANKDDMPEKHSTKDEAENHEAVEKNPCSPLGGTGKPCVYKPLRKPAELFQILSIFQCSLGALAILNVVAIYMFAIAGAEETTAALTQVSSVIDVLQPLFYISASVVFIVWLRRAFRNLRALNVNEMATQEWHCIFGWLIPVASLILPMLAVAEVWKASDPEADLTYWYKNKGSRLVLTCWIVYAIYVTVQAASKMVERLSSHMKVEIQEFAQLIGVPLFFLDEFFFVATGILFILVVRSTTSRQERKYDVIQSSST